jgi:hypothetical protein
MNMERSIRAEVSAGWGRWIAWSGLLVLLLVWQGWLTLGLFGGAAGWANLLNDEPVISGAHPQHLYFGFLGAQGWRDNGSNCVYDTAFQNGYPKTPIFDGSRLAELVLFVANDIPPARAYKIGLAGICLAVPIFLVVTCWGVGVNWATTAFASSLGLLIFWSPHGRAGIEAGDAEMFIAALAVLCHIGLLIRYDRAPGLIVCFGLAVTGALGILAQPMLFPIVLPLLLTYYLTAGVRHGMTWHLSLFITEAAAVGLNLIWLPDWFTYWWMRSPFPVASELLPHRTLGAFWAAPIWGGPGFRLLALILVGSGVVGVAIWNETRQRATARLLGFGAVGLLLLALLGISWEPLGQMGTSIFLTPALWFAAIPAAHAWVWLISTLARTNLGRCGLALVVGGVGVASFFARGDLEVIAARAAANEPLTFGLSPNRQDLVAILKSNTTPDARILWEDRKLSRKASRWSILLPWLTERYYIGGLDPAGTIEHSSISFIDEALDGRPIGLWSDQGLDDYCRRYNVGWIVAWSPKVIDRLRAWPGVKKEITVVDDVPGSLFLLHNPPPGYVVRGEAKIVAMSSKHIVLTDVVPTDGEVVLNLHYVAGLKATPSRVSIERLQCGHDPIGFIRLKMASPVPVLTIAWDRTR